MKTAKGKKMFPVLLCVYTGVVLIRFVLALMTTSYPTIGIDEFLYYSLGRSIATKGELLFRGQAADYAFIFYPLLLSPVYLLFGDGAHFYRLLQLWNILMMSTSIFPLFFLGKKLLGSEKKALTVAALSMLIPDFVLGEFILSEAILYPLFFTLMFCAYSYLKKRGKHFLFCIGLIGGLLFSTKPGAVVPAVVYIFFILGRSLIGRNWKETTWAIISFFITLLTAAAFWGLAKGVFGYQGGLLSIYEMQVNGAMEWHFDAFLKALAIYPYYFILSCGITGVIYPAISWREWAAEKRFFWWFVTVSLAVMMIGSAWAVEQKTGETIVQVRYIAMYMPLLIYFCFLEGQKTEDKKKPGQKRPGIVGVAFLLGYVVLCTLLFGCKVNTRTTNTYAQIALSLLNDRILPLSGQIWGNVIILLLCAVVLFLFVKLYKKKNFSTVCVMMMTGTMLINGAFGYSFIHEFHSANLEKEGLTVHQLTEGEPYLYILSDELVADYGVDVNTRQNNYVVYMNDFVNCLQRNNGIYVPYIPEKMRGMASVSETPDVNIIVVDYDSYPFFRWSENVTVQSPFDRGLAYVIRFTPGERIVDSSLSNLKKQMLNPGTPGIILIYNEEYLQKPVTIRLKIKSEIKQELSINSTHEMYSIELAPGEAWYEIAFKQDEAAFNFSIQEAPIKLSGYELITAE